MNLNLAEMTVLALCHFLFKPFEDCCLEDHIDLGQGFFEALPGLSPEMKDKVVAMAGERLSYLSDLPPLPADSKSYQYRQQEMAFLDAMANDPEFIDRIGL
jgi:hypothetical protein